jgi:hypothetical protein
MANKGYNVYNSEGRIIKMKDTAKQAITWAKRQVGRTEVWEDTYDDRGLVYNTILFWQSIGGVEVIRQWEA